MPTYNFRHRDSQEIILVECSMHEREEFIEANPEYEQILIHTPTIVDPLMLGRLSPTGKDFQRNVLGRMAAAIPGNNLGTQMKRFGAGNMRET